MHKVSLNAVRIGAALAALILACAVIFTWLHVRKDGGLPPIAGIGGPFALVDHHGKPVTERDFLGKPILVFFGFTHCPEVCPTTLFALTIRLEELGPDAGRLNIVFITVDGTLAKLASVKSSYLPAMAKVCLAACQDCEAECRKHADKHAVCKACAEACAACAAECKKAAA